MSETKGLEQTPLPERKMEQRTLTFDQQMDLMPATIKQFFSQDLTIVMGQAELLGVQDPRMAARLKLDEKRAEYATDIHQAGSRMADALSGLNELLSNRQTRSLEIDIEDAESPAIILNTIKPVNLANNMATAVSGTAPK